MPIERAELERLVRSRSTTQGMAARARIVLGAARGFTNQQIAKSVHISVISVGKWRTRFYLFGMAGLADSKGRGRPPKYSSKIEQQLRILLCRAPYGGKRRWTIRVLAGELNIPPSTLHELLRKIDLPRSRYLPWRVMRS